MPNKFDCVVQAWVTKNVVVCQVFEDIESFLDAMDRMDSYMKATFPELTVKTKRAFSTTHIGPREDEWKAPYHWDSKIWPDDLKGFLGTDSPSL